jgi:hypothetical protein
MRNRLRWPIVIVLVGLCVLVVLLAADTLFLDGVREVRIDSGDRRIRGLILTWPEEPVPARKYLLRAAAEAGIPSEWHRPPFTAPSYTGQGRYWQYSRMAWWAQHEPSLGKVMLRQFAEYYRHPPAESGWPPAAHFLSMLEWDERTGYQLKERPWPADRDALQSLLDDIGYTPEPRGIVAGILDNLRPS